MSGSEERNSAMSMSLRGALYRVVAAHTVTDPLNREVDYGWVLFNKEIVLCEPLMEVGRYV